MLRKPEKRAFQSLLFNAAGDTIRDAQFCAQFNVMFVYSWSESAASCLPNENSSRTSAVKQEQNIT